MIGVRSSQQSQAMAFVLRFLLRAFPTVIEPVAVNADVHESDPEIGRANAERARTLKARLARISESAATTDSAWQDIDAAMIVTRDLLLGIASAAAEDAEQVVARGPPLRQWLWSLVNRALRSPG